MAYPPIAQYEVFAVIAAPLLFAVVVYITRATLRRLAGALLAAFGFGMVNLGLDVLAYYAGWWHYPFTTAPYAALPSYLASGLFYGGGTALVGWRIQRRFGLLGLLIFLGLFTLYGSLRDVGGAAAMHNVYIVFGAGLVPALADAASWLADLALAQVLMRALAGPATSDLLARQRKEKQS